LTVDIQVTVSSDYSPDLAEALARGRLDLAFLRVEPGYDFGYHWWTGSPSSS
jgi:LysR family transcriptional regulator, hca operon transcriptional activator